MLQKVCAFEIKDYVCMHATQTKFRDEIHMTSGRITVVQGFVARTSSRESALWPEQVHVMRGLCGKNKVTLEANKLGGVRVIIVMSSF